MKYIKIDEKSIVREIIPDFDPVFLGVPIEQRYEKSFLDKCLETPDGVEVEQNWFYDPIKNAFFENGKNHE